MSVWLDFLIRYADMKKPPSLKEEYSSANKINSRGDRFEFFIKDLLSGAIDESHKTIQE